MYMSVFNHVSLYEKHVVYLLTIYNFFYTISLKVNESNG